jgi:hypothetical protein
MPRLDMYAAGTTARYGSAVVGSAAGPPAGDEMAEHQAQKEAAGRREQGHAGGDPCREEGRAAEHDHPEDGVPDRFPH